MSASKNIFSANLNAACDMLGISEGTANSPITQDDGYDIIVTGIEGRERFDDYSDHPFADGRPAKTINHAGLMSTASGRYQFILRTWKYYQRLLNLPDFSPRSQDLAAQEDFKQHNALTDIENGEIVSAIGKCATEWASLPGGNSGQHENAMNSLLSTYEDAGGIIA